MVLVTTLTEIMQKRMNYTAMLSPDRMLKHGKYRGRQWWSNSYILEFTDSLPQWKAIRYGNRGENKTDLIDSLITPDKECELVTRWLKDDCYNGVDYVILNGQSAVNIHFINRFAKRYDDIRFLISLRNNANVLPIIAKSEGKVVGLIMPLVLAELYNASLVSCKNRSEEPELCNSCFVRYRCWTERNENANMAG